MKNLLSKLVAILVLLVIVSCTKEEEIVTNDTATEAVVDRKTPLSISEINAKIETALNSKDGFSWENVSAHTLWSAVYHGNNVLTIGYGNQDESFSENAQRSQELSTIKDEILNSISQTESFKRSKENVSHYDVINVVDVKVENLETIEALLERNDIRYIEPNGYNHFNPQTRSSSGCDKSGKNINPAYYQTVAPNNAQVSWNFYLHNIPQAWNHSTGSGVTIGLIDTGVSQSQSLLNPAGFNDGYSNGRTVEKYGTFIDSWWWWSNNYDGPHDKCGHGTAMASTMAAPRNDNGMPVGVAYNANLVAYRATEDVVLNDYHERKGVSNALIQLGNRNDVKIISMSIGYPWSIGNIRDAVRFAHSRGKLIFAAGGTSTNFTNWYGVIFPATMSEVVAVTGVDDGSNYEECDTCHKGGKIDFTIVTEAESLPGQDGPLVLNFYNNQRRYTGASSAATATTAGIAALVWSKYPNWSREQVLNRLKQSSDLYPNKSSDFGYGNIDALQAVQ